MNIINTIKERALKYLPEVITVLILVGMFGVYATSFASVATRQPIVFQGRLTDTSYVPSADGIYPMKFKIWDAASGGACVWATGTSTGIANCGGTFDKMSPDVTVSRGVFTVRLGDNSSGSDNNPAIDVSFDNGSYYLEVTVGPIGGSATDTLGPRVRIGGAPYSYNADLFDALDSTSFVRSDLVPTGVGVLQGTSIINPATATTEYTLLGLGVGGTEKFRVDAEGDIDAAGKLRVGSITAPVATADINGNLRVTGKATAVLTGSIDPTASTSVTGVGTLFSKELVIGDRITVSGETRTVTVITSDTALTVDTAFSDNGNDTAVDVLYALATINDATSVLSMVVNDQGHVGIGTATPSTSLDVAGLTINTDADLTVAGTRISGTFTKNDSNTRTFSVAKIVPTFNFGVAGPNANTTVNVLDIDTTNTSTTGNTTNLIKASYGGSPKLTVDSSGNMNIAGNIVPTVDNTQTIGTSALRWQTVHVGPGSVVIHNDNTDTQKATLGFSGANAAQIKTDATTALQVTTGTNSGINVDTTGNVGIGVASSIGSLLHVAGNAQLGTPSTTTGQLKLYNSASANATIFQAGNASTAETYIWPTTDGSNGQVLTTDGNGVLTWTTVSGGGGGSGVNHATTVDWFDDFLGGTRDTGFSNGATGLGDLGWTFGSSGTASGGAPASFQLANNEIGVVSLASGTTTGEADLYASAGAVRGGQANETITFRAKLPAAPNDTIVQIGLGSDLASADLSSGLFFQLSSGVWEGKTNDGGAASTTSASVAVDTGWHIFTITNTSGSSVTFAIDGTPVGSAITTNIPDRHLFPVIRHVKNTNVANRSLYVDYYGISVTGLTR